MILTSSKMSESNGENPLPTDSIKVLHIYENGMLASPYRSIVMPKKTLKKGNYFWFKIDR